MRGIERTTNFLRPSLPCCFGSRSFHGFWDGCGADWFFNDSERVVVFEDLGCAAELIDLLHQLPDLLFFFAYDGVNILHRSPLCDH